MVQEAILTTDALLAGLKDIEPLNTRIAEWSESRRKGFAPVYASQDFIDRLPEDEKKMYTPLQPL
jgi:hypothetical protein